MMDYTEKKLTHTVEISKIPEILGTPCLICGDSVSSYNSGPRICDQCKNAVLSLRRLLEYLEEQDDEDT